MSEVINIIDAAITEPFSFQIQTPCSYSGPSILHWIILMIIQNAEHTMKTNHRTLNSIILDLLGKFKTLWSLSELGYWQTKLYGSYRYLFGKCPLTS